MTKIPLIANRIKTFYKARPWRGRTILALLAVTLVLGTARLLLPQTIIYSTTSWLKKQGIESTIEAINIDIFDGTISLVNARGHKDGSPLFNIGLVDIYWRWSPLSEKTIVVTKVGLDQFSVNIEQYNGEIVIGGVKIPLNRTPDTQTEVTPVDNNEPDKQAKPWAAELGEVIFTDLSICYLQHMAPREQANRESLFVDYCVDLEEMSWAGTISYATDEALLKSGDLPLSSTGDFTLKGLSVTDNKLDRKLLVSESNTLDNVIISGLNSFHVDELDMKDLSLLHRADDKHRDSIRFSNLTIDDINVSNLNDVSINNINMSAPGVYLLKQNQTDWEYQEWIPQSPGNGETSEAPENDKQPDSKPSFALSLNNIIIDSSDLCYQDNSTSIYYCLTFHDFTWTGSAKYETGPSDTGAPVLLVKGDMKLSQPNISNLTIDRDLINLDTLSLSSLDVSGMDNVSLKSLSIDNLAALQRGKNKDDNTASFQRLLVDGIKYAENKIDIESIDLKGLTNTVSINKNGTWEHDKWLSKEKGPKQKGKTKAEDIDSSTKADPLVIAFKKVNVTSDRKILFTDNSTQPAMKAGLQKLNLSASDIYSNKPDSNIPFKLHAQTILHSTIDIEGTAKPFAEKISFDADGKLKGFDLRAVSPATKKAIGHIIKSGQLDADLKLLAVDGVLDSNIGLSLYHFNIKATSKEDAEKLDKQFGMPLNQTLVLLRDKDDSIHLDIPITGDVNNPNFDPMDAIVKATSKAATVTLITFYTPYGLIYAGGNVAFNLATALNFEPINFAPGSAEILADSKEQLDGLSKLLTEKPQVHLTLCGITNQQDTFTLYPAFKEEYERNKKQDDKNKTEVALTEEQSQKLEHLARDRQVNSKSYLIKNSGIAHDRLILCAPEHRKEEDAIAGVEITI